MPTPEEIANQNRENNKKTSPLPQDPAPATPPLDENAGKENNEADNAENNADDKTAAKPKAPKPSVEALKGGGSTAYEKHSMEMASSALENASSRSNILDAPGQVLSAGKTVVGGVVSAGSAVVSGVAAAPGAIGRKLGLLSNTEQPPTPENVSNSVAPAPKPGKKRSRAEELAAEEQEQAAQAKKRMP